jgi:UDP-3-O-[3-hydroxymyristoyl] glucosamine N-acyltransferase
LPDSRFYADLGPVSLSDLADVAGAELAGADSGWADRTISAAAPLARAGAGDVAFFADRRYRPALQATAAGACFLKPEHLDMAPDGCARLVASEPHVAWSKAALRLHRPHSHPSDEPAIHPTAEIEDGAAYGPGVVIGPGAKVGRGTIIGANAVIGPGVSIGRDCRIGANVTVLFALLGDRVRVLSGAVIGESGFGVAGAANAVMDVPQLGRVIIQDDVTVGASTCIDRGAWDDTVVGEGTKIDNLVQIAHNVRLGRFCLLAAHTGISGSVTVGDGAVFGGRAGIADHLEIGAGARIAAAAGVMKSVPPGEMWVGSPARPIRRFMRETAWLARQASRPGSREGRGDGDD